MTIDPTREEWLAARERVRTQAHAMFNERESDRLTTAALGPCPPKPAPEPLRYRALQPGQVVRVRDDVLQLGQTVRVCAVEVAFDQDDNETHTVELERVEHAREQEENQCPRSS